jgi:translation elongation factor EF-1alpha
MIMCQKQNRIKGINIKTMVENNELSQCDLVVLGHSNTGKSTLCGRILLDTGLVDDRDIVSLKRDATSNGRESWWIAYLMDQEPSERKKGVTENVSRVCF